HIQPPRDHFPHLSPGTESHRITRLASTQKRFARFHGPHHFLFRLAHAHAANRVAVKGYIDNRLCARFTQIIKRCALDDAEEQRIGESASRRVGESPSLRFSDSPFPVCTSPCPSRRHFRAARGVFVLAGIRSAFIQHHS